MIRKIERKIERMAMVAQYKFADFLKKEDGDVNIVSIVVLIGIAVVLAIIFRKAIINLINNLFKQINTNANGAIKTQ